MVAAGNHCSSVVQADPERLFDAVPMREYARSLVAAAPAKSRGSKDSVSDADALEGTSGPVAHQDRCVTRHAVAAGVEAAAVGIHAPAEADVGAVVVREDLARVIFVDLEARGRGLLEVLDLGGGPRVGRVRDRLQHGRIYCTEQAFRSNGFALAMSCAAIHS